MVRPAAVSESFNSALIGRTATEANDGGSFNVWNRGEVAFGGESRSGGLERRRHGWSLASCFTRWHARSSDSFGLDEVQQRSDGVANHRGILAFANGRYQMVSLHKTAPESLALGVFVSEAFLLCLHRFRRGPAGDDGDHSMAVTNDIPTADEKTNGDMTAAHRETGESSSGHRDHDFIEKFEHAAPGYGDERGQKAIDDVKDEDNPNVHEHVCVE